jgi:hypothetical protein
MSFAKHPERSEGHLLPVFYFNDYRLRTNNCKKRSILHAGWAKPSQVERGLGRTIIPSFLIPNIAIPD